MSDEYSDMMRLFNGMNQMEKRGIAELIIRGATEYDNEYQPTGVWVDGIRSWLRNELKSLLPREESCGYGMEVHNAGNKVIRSFMKTDEFKSAVRAAIKDEVRTATPTPTPPTVAPDPELERLLTEDAAPSWSFEDARTETRRSVTRGRDLPDVPTANVAVTARFLYGAEGGRRYDETLSVTNIQRLAERNHWHVKMIAAGVAEVRGLPSEWLQQLARDGSFIHSDSLDTGISGWYRIEVRV